MRRALSNVRLIGILAFALQVRIGSPHFRGAGDGRAKPWKSSSAFKNTGGGELASPSSHLFDLVLETVALEEAPVEHGEADHHSGVGSEEEAQAPPQQEGTCVEAADAKIWDAGDVVDFWFGGSALENMKTRLLKAFMYASARHE
jgi:hypothetical protein